MAVTSIAAAVIARYGTLTFSGKPKTLWLGPASAKNGDGTSVDLPIVEFFEEQGQLDQTFEHHPMMVRVPFRFEVFGATLASAWAVTKGILWNGSTPDLAAGISTGATLTYDANTYSHRGVKLLSWPMSEGMLDPRDPSAGRVYRVAWRIEVSAEWTG